MFGLVVCPSCGSNLGVVGPAFAFALAKLEPPRKEEAAVSSGFAGFAAGMARGPLLDALGVERVCCRMHMISSVTLGDVLGPALDGPGDARIAHK